MEATKKPSKPLLPLIKLTIYTLSSLAAAGIIAYSMISLSTALGGFSAEVLLSPIRCGYTVLLKSMIMYILLGTVLIVTGIRNSKLWYLLPVGLIVLAGYWLMSSLFVVKMLAKLMEQ